MKKLLITLTLVFGLLLAIAPITSAQNAYIVDETNQFTSQQLATLEAKLQKISAAHNMDVVMYVTSVTNVSEYKLEQIADDYWDNNGYGQGSDHSGILFIITADNMYYFSTCGKGITYFTDYGLEKLSDFFYRSYHFASTDPFYTAFVELADEMERYIISAEGGSIIDYYYNRIVINLKDSKGRGVDGEFAVYENGKYVTTIWVTDGYGYSDIETSNTNAEYVIKCVNIPSNYDPLPDKTVKGSSQYTVNMDAGNRKTNFALLGGVSAAIGTLISSIYTGTLKSKNKSVAEKTTAREYVKPGSFHLYGNRDLYLYSRVSRTEIPRHNDSDSGSSHHSGGSFSGGSSTHSSSSGVSHGGGGHGRL